MEDGRSKKDRDRNREGERSTQKGVYLRQIEESFQNLNSSVTPGTMRCGRRVHKVMTTGRQGSMGSSSRLPATMCFTRKGNIYKSMI